MISIKDLTVKLKSGTNVKILKNISLDFHPGNIYFFTGRNGSGKSTLVNTIMGNPQFEIKSGQITIINEKYNEFTFAKIKSDIDESVTTLRSENLANGQINISELLINEISPTTRSKLGLFLASQYPTEIPGINLTSFLRLIYNSQKPASEQLSVFKFKKYLTALAEKIKYPAALLKRNLNEGFSGGEKKKTEILQMMLLNPRYIFLDEVDSGLDKSSTIEIFQALQAYHTQYPTATFIIITHYENSYTFFPKHQKIEMYNGEILSFENNLQF